MKESRKKNNQKTYLKACPLIVYILAILLIFSVLNNPYFCKGMPGGGGVGKNAINPAGIMTGLGNGMHNGMGIGKNATNPAGIMTGLGNGMPGGMGVGKNVVNPTGIMTGLGNGMPSGGGIGKNAINPAGIMTGLGNQNNFQGPGIINNVDSGQNWTIPNGLSKNITNNMGSTFSENGFGITFEDQEAFIGQQSSSIIVKLSPGSSWVLEKQRASRNNKCLLASGDIFSEALTNSGLAAASLEVPDPIGAKGPNPTHGGTHPKKGDGNPGGGNNNGHWGQGNQGNGLGNIWVGNQGRGVGEGMTGGTKGQNIPGDGIDASSVSDPGGEIVSSGMSDSSGEINPSGASESSGEIGPSGASDPAGESGETENLTDLSAPLVPLQVAMIEGCPFEMQAVALELGITKSTIQVSIDNALALNPTIQPCKACATLIETIAILRDEDGSRMAALEQIFNELAPAEAPFSPEMAAAIAMVFANAAEGSQYESVMKYIDAFVRYVSVLDTELGSPVGDSVAFVMEKHGADIVGSDNPNIGAFIATRLEGLVTFGK